MTNKKKIGVAFALFALIVIVDQWVKFYVKTNFRLGESYEVFSWFYIRFVENNGMAFGIELGPKIILSTLRIIMCGGLLYYLYSICQKNYRITYLLSVAALTAGVMGNIFDCLFYGMIFSESTPFSVATLFPEAGGYAAAFQGRVVDMLYFPLIESRWPEAMPFCGGEKFVFFSPVFNIADSFITVSIIYAALFERDCIEREFGRLDAWWNSLRKKNSNTSNETEPR